MRGHPILLTLVLIPMWAAPGSGEDPAPALTPEALDELHKEEDAAREAEQEKAFEDEQSTLSHFNAEDLYKGYEDVTVSSELDNSRPTIGDWVTCRITVRGPKGVKFKKAELPQKLPDYVALKFRTSGPQKESADGVEKTWELLLDFYFTGKFPLPPVIITYEGLDGKDRQVLAPMFFVDLQDLPLDPENASDIRPLKAVAEIPASYRNLYVIAAVTGAVLLVLGAGLFFFVRWLRKPEYIPPTPAHEIAYAEMRRLINDQLVEQGRIEEFYVRLSNICRRYLENRFGLRAPERTTEEFLIEMAETNVLADSHRRLVPDFLRHCDLVKFARYSPERNEMEEAFASAKRLVDETRQRDEHEVDSGNESAEGKPEELAGATA